MTPLGIIAIIMFTLSYVHILLGRCSSFKGYLLNLFIIIVSLFFIINEAGKSVKVTNSYTMLQESKW